MYKFIKYILILLSGIFLLQSNKICAQLSGGKSTKPLQEIWVDSVLNSLSLEEKIAQMFVVRANNPGNDFFKNIDKYIKEYNIGGVTFFRSTPYKQAVQTNHWQSLARTPLFISIDAEWGLGMRLDSTISFPFQMTLGAINHDSLIFEMGKEIGRQCRVMGIQMNFAPVVDINNNPDNPVINSRSFGEDKYNVYRKGLAYTLGLQEYDIIATAKHFPGHGDTDTDSHYTLPLINHSRSRLDSVELFPFAQLINNGIEAIMIAHLFLPAYESEEETAATLSDDIITGLLRDSLGFDGLIVTDALDMKGVTKYFKPGEIELKALMAGNDILLLPEDVPKAIKAIVRAHEKGIISNNIINERCRKILKYKYQAGLNNINPVDLSSLIETLNTSEAEFINRQLFKSAITVVKNTNNLLPLLSLDTLQIASLVIGEDRKSSFQKMLDNYDDVQHFNIGSEPEQAQLLPLIDQFRHFNLVIVGINNTNIFAGKNFGISDETIKLVQGIAKEKTVILDLFANPYSLSFFDSTSNIESIIMSYQDDDIVQELSAQLIFGGIGAMGNLPVTASSVFPLNTGITTERIRLEYTSPQEFNIAESDISIIDSIALSGIDNKAYPGCQVIAVKDGRVFYNKEFGYHTFDRKNDVETLDVYDLASLTKIAATTISIMKLYQEGKLDVDDRIEKYLPYLRDTKKGKIIIRDLMAHQAGLQAWIPYFRFTLNDKGDPDSVTYSNTISEDYPVRVAEDFYIEKNYSFDIFDSIIYSPFRDDHSYKYSDLGFILLAEIVENVTNQAFDEYVNTNFYQPLGLNNLSYLPRRKYSLSRIVPTEKEEVFRKQLLHGDVHDPGAAMLGGIAGHAGLFSNANDMAKLAQMLLQKGQYGTYYYLDSTIVDEFTKCQFPLNQNRRGLGFDKPMLDPDMDGPSCKGASPESYGHSGFTGTYFWVDPEENLVYVFLTNRVHPDASNIKLLELDIRTNLHQAIYDALENGKEKTYNN